MGGDDGESTAAGSGEISKRSLKRKKLLEKKKANALGSSSSSSGPSGGSSSSSSSSVTTAAVVGQTAAADQEKAVVVSTRSEIDDIFSAKPAAAPSEPKKPEKPTSTASAGGDTRPEAKRARRDKPPSRGSADDILGTGDSWKDDGLGGIYNGEGWTGRKTSGDGLRIFKAHLIGSEFFGEAGPATAKKKKAGTTKLCPFDCECCF